MFGLALRPARTGARACHPSSSENVQEQPVRYATFRRRFHAFVVDVAVITAVVVFVAISTDIAENVPGYGRFAWLLMFAALFLYEPFFVWWRGATVGHAMNHLTVVADRTGRSPGLARAFARYLIKGTLGLPCFVVMAFTKRHQALHDLVTKTTVQVETDVALDPGEYHVERTADASILLPSRTRRALVMIAYLVALFIGFGVLLYLIDPRGCLRDNSCPDGTRALGTAVTFVYYGASLLAIVAAWKGLLFGARRTRLPEAESIVA
jgi:uncharacterized RDD family membrane protein YckC